MSDVPFDVLTEQHGEMVLIPKEIEGAIEKTPAKFPVGGIHETILARMS